jgi:hypothetical protein
LTKILKHLSEAKEKGAKKNAPDDKHAHVVYSSGDWANRKWQYRVYSVPKGKEKDLKTHLGNEGHHVKLAKEGWHVETVRIADRKDYDKTQNDLNKQIIKHASKDADIRKRLTAIEKPKEPKKK